MRTTRFTGGSDFVFNKLQGGSLSENYPLAAAKGVIDEENNKVTLKGTLITEMYPAFGYADVKSANPQLHEEASPYAENQKSADGFDLKWAVDPETGNPVDLSDAEIHYVKVYTANFSKGETNIGEQSTEVSYVVRQIGEDAEVGVTEVSGITLDGETVSFDSGNEAEVELEPVSYTHLTLPTKA